MCPCLLGNDLVFLFLGSSGRGSSSVVLAVCINVRVGARPERVGVGEKVVVFPSLHIPNSA
jgi:hypothetical protein